MGRRELGNRLSRRVLTGMVALVLGSAPVAAVRYEPVHGDGRVAEAVAAAPGKVGAWQAPRRWPVPAIHAFLLPTGEVLHYAYSSAHGDPQDRHYYDGSQAVVWDPEKNRFVDISWDGTVFCSGHSFLPDGRLFVTGGLEQVDCLTQGRRETWLLDPFTLEWSAGPDMSKPRYYPTNLSLGDGSVMILSGNNGSCAINPKMEIFRPDRGRHGKLSSVTNGTRQIHIYPRVHLLPDGRVVQVGPEVSTWIWSPETRRWSRLESSRMLVQRFEGASWVVPGRPFEVMTCGGYDELNRNPTATCERIDFSGTRPTWTPAPSMHYPRAHANAVLLPDGKVLVVGGGAHDLYIDPRFNPELYDPESDSWTVLPAQRWGRMYHSTAILLPDGRVLSGGQDEHPGSANDSGTWAEIYEPAYLFGSRPKIRSAPASFAYGEAFEVTAKGAGKVDSAVLLGLSAQTHSVNMGQRYVALEVRPGGTRKALTLTAPENRHLAPPGYYLLFLVNRAGRPSRAHIVRIAG